MADEDNSLELLDLAKSFVQYFAIATVIAIVLFHHPLGQNLFFLSDRFVFLVFLFFAGLSIRSVGTKIKSVESVSAYQPVFVCIGLIVAAFAFWQWTDLLNVSFISSEGQEFLEVMETYNLDFHILVNTIRKASSVFLVVLGFASLSFYGGDNGSKSVSGFSNWIIDKRRGFAFVGLLFTVYFMLVEKVLFSVIRPYYVEMLGWGLILLVPLYYFRDFYNNMRKFFTESREFSAQEDYRSIIENIEGLEESEFGKPQKIFIEKGIKGDLVYRLVQRVESSPVPNENIPYLISRLVNYQDESSPVSGFNWIEERIKRGNKETRKKILEEVMETVEAWQAEFPSVSETDEGDQKTDDEQD